MTGTAGPVVFVQHLDAEGPGTIGAACARAGLVVEAVRTDRGDAVPRAAAGLGGVVVMGGTMSAASDDGYPTRRDELALVGDALSRGVPVLGVCLGAQLLALAAGGTVHRGGGVEVGWIEVELLPAAARDPLLGALPPRPRVMSWHGDTYDLPPGAEQLARSARYEQQAFRVGPSAWGLQFHLEVDATTVATWVASSPDEAAAADGGAAGLLAATTVAVDAVAPFRDQVFDRFAAACAAGGPAPG